MTTIIVTNTKAKKRLWKPEYKVNSHLESPKIDNRRFKSHTNIPVYVPITIPKSKVHVKSENCKIKLILVLKSPYWNCSITENVVWQCCFISTRELNDGRKHFGTKITLTFTSSCWLYHYETWLILLCYTKSYVQRAASSFINVKWNYHVWYGNITRFWISNYGGRNHYKLWHKPEMTSSDLKTFLLQR